MTINTISKPPSILDIIQVAQKKTVPSVATSNISVGVTPTTIDDMMEDARDKIEQLIRKEDDCKNYIGTAAFLSTIPDAFYRAAVKYEHRIELPPLGQYATGIVFISRDSLIDAKEAFQKLIKMFRLELIVWRHIKTIGGALEYEADISEPMVGQVFITAKYAKYDPETFERNVYKLYTHFLTVTNKDHCDFYINSLSSSTIVYKGPFDSFTLFEYYDDLMHEDYIAEFGLIYETSSDAATKGNQKNRALLFRATDTQDRRQKALDSYLHKMDPLMFGNDFFQAKPVPFCLNSKNLPKLLNPELVHWSTSVYIEQWDTYDLDYLFDLKTSSISLSCKNSRPSSNGSEHLHTDSSKVAESADTLNLTLRKQLLGCLPHSKLSPLAIICGKMDDPFFIIKTYNEFLKTGQHASFVEAIMNHTTVEEIGKDDYVVPKHFIESEEYKNARNQIDMEFMAAKLRRLFFGIFNANRLANCLEHYKKIIEAVDDWKEISDEELQYIHSESDIIDETVKNEFGDSIPSAYRITYNATMEMEGVIHLMERHSYRLKVCCYENVDLDKRVRLYFADISQILSKWALVGSKLLEMHTGNLKKLAKLIFSRIPNPVAKKPQYTLPEKFSTSNVIEEYRKELLEMQPSTQY